MKFPISLDKLGIRNWDDLIFYFPNRYIDESKTIKIRELSTTKLMQVQVEVENAKIVPIKIEYNAFKFHPLEYM